MSRTALVPRIVALVGTTVALPCLFSCLEHPLKPVHYESGQEEEERVQLQVNKDVDILFVIDNSGSMGEEQAKLSKNFDDFVSILEAPTVDANFRIGVTTTDRGQKDACNSGTIDNGKLQLSSCLDRPSDFSFDGEDKFAEACGDYCQFDDDALTISPTATHVSSGVREPRPWLESIEGARNIPDEISMVEAFQCVGPQGINGCGFESHLESQYVALNRTNNADEESYGFIRPQALLAIVHVTDEVDCSTNPEWSDIFSDDSEGGNQVFWSNTELDWPTSAVCWNAGVDCTPADPNGFYDECHSADKDVNGELTSDPDAAVLYPLDRYIGQLQDLEDEKKRENIHQEIVVALIGGVDGNGEAQYSDGDGGVPDFTENFGVGPGCQSGAGDDLQTAVPPVRLAEFVDHFEGDMFSVCSDDYGAALTRVAKALEDQLGPACFTKCPMDTDSATGGLQPECTVAESETGATEVEREVPECARDESGAYLVADDDYVQPSPEANVCFAMLTDADHLTASEFDDLDPDCLLEGYALEFKIARRSGFPAAADSEVTAKCSLSDFPQLDCEGA